MDKKEEESLINRSVNRSLNAFKKVIFGSGIRKVVDHIKEEVEETIEDAKIKVNKILDDLTANIMSFFLILSGLIFCFVGLAYFLLEQTILSKSTAFMLTGLLILVLGWLSLRKVKESARL